MTDASREVPELVTHESLTAAAAAYSHRCGDAEPEAHRRGRVHAVQRSSAELAAALEQFLKKAAPSVRGEHSSSDMSGEVDALHHALVNWSFSVNAAAHAYHEGRCEPQAQQR